ncbi:TPA: DUF927 domain-containing protein [Yersinia enterocolitica]|nr:DUF927 domain-containing protein [Yersinia enterocolitica]HEN3585215.1 DUF927 domain-containing protein [Yersinia enterocolitica]
MMKKLEKKLTESEQELFVELIANNKMLSAEDVAYRQIKVFSENSNKSIRILIPSTTFVSKYEVKKALLKAGHRSDMPSCYWDLAYAEITKQTDNKVLLRYKPGFYGDVYLRINDKVIGDIKGDMPVLHPNAKKHLPVEEEKGTLKEWKENVAINALYSSRIMLALCSGFSGFLLDSLGIEGGGFHLWGKSSMGKSSCGYILASIAGEPNSIIILWSNTDKALEEIAVVHNDATLILDESKLLDKDPILAAKTIQNRVYTITGGKGKVRAALFENKVAEWRLVVFSTGELSLAQHAEVGKIERLDGENVRVIDVPADAGFEMGIFESLPEKVASSNELAHSIQKATSSYYGTAKLVFLNKLIASIQSDSLELKDMLEAEMDYFLDKNNVDRDSGIQVRIAKRFALTYAAGFLASKYGILPFKAKAIMNGISKCYQDSINTPCSKEPTISEMLPQSIKDVLKSDQIVNLIEHEDYSGRDIKNDIAIICMAKGVEVIAIDKKFIHDYLNIKSRKNVLAKLTKMGVLLVDSQKEYSTVQLHHRSGISERRYCFVRNRLSSILK